MKFKTTSAFFIMTLLCVSKLAFSQGIVINEIMSSNTKTIYDEDGDTPDWLELYNCSSEQINIQGYSLSDDSLDIKKWRFGNAVINPGEYLIVFASDKDTSMNFWHTNFKISASGECIILSDCDGLVLEQVEMPASESDVSYGRISDGSLPWIFQMPSPGSTSKGEEIQDFSDSVSVSLPGGFYSSTVAIELSAGESDIFYTLDG
ncbi:MAG: lamin tail domain-containing protein, partial [bacterium]|nr:lamin tail domain-containing protein [bacterium]